MRVPDVKLTSFLGPPTDGIGYIQLASFSQVGLAGCRWSIHIVRIQIQIYQFTNTHKQSTTTMPERPLRAPGVLGPAARQRAQPAAEGPGARPQVE